MVSIANNFAKLSKAGDEKTLRLKIFHDTFSGSDRASARLDLCQYGPANFGREQFLREIHRCQQKFWYFHNF
jgi:hypothetical protein